MAVPSRLPPTPGSRFPFSDWGSVQLIIEDTARRQLQIERVKRQEARRDEFERQNPYYQPKCRCGHRKWAHEGGSGPCTAHRCRCTDFVAAEV
jgi:hypothetical protein